MNGASISAILGTEITEKGWNMIKYFLVLLALVMPVVSNAADKKKKDVYVAADCVGAGIGEQVLVVSGSTARKAFGREDVPADMAIVGIIDTLEVNREKLDLK